MQHTRALRLSLVAALSVSSFAAAQQPTDPPLAEIKIGKEGFVLPSGEFTLTELIDKSAEFLRWNILFSADEVAQYALGNIRLQRAWAVDATGCEEVLCELLYVQGFALVEMDSSKNMYEVVCMDGPRGGRIFERAALRTPEEILQRPNLKVPVITELQLQHIYATRANDALRPFLSFGGGGRPSMILGTAGNDRTLMISGYQYRIAALIQLLRAADVPRAKQPRQPRDDQLQKLQEAVAQLREQVAKLSRTSGSDL